MYLEITFIKALVLVHWCLHYDSYDVQIDDMIMLWNIGYVNIIKYDDVKEYHNLLACCYVM